MPAIVMATLSAIGLVNMKPIVLLFMLTVMTDVFFLLVTLSLFAFLTNLMSLPSVLLAGAAQRDRTSLAEALAKTDPRSQHLPARYSLPALRY
jgi:hypothetical protein